MAAAAKNTSIGTSAKLSSANSGDSLATPRKANRVAIFLSVLNAIVILLLLGKIRYKGKQY